MWTFPDLFICLVYLSVALLKAFALKILRLVFWCYNWMDELGFGGLEYKM